MWRISGVIDGVLVNALVEMVHEMAIRLLKRTTVESCVLLELESRNAQMIREGKDKAERFEIVEGSEPVSIFGYFLLNPEITGRYSAGNCFVIE